jgi:hypothetical protein
VIAVEGNACMIRALPRMFVASAPRMRRRPDSCWGRCRRTARNSSVAKRPGSMAGAAAGVPRRSTIISAGTTHPRLEIDTSRLRCM